MGDGQTVNGQARVILAVSAFLSALAILAVALRFYTKTYKGARLYLDDWLILAGLAITLGVTINNIVGVAVGGIGEQELWTNVYADDGVALFPTPEELLPDGKVMFVMQIMHTCAMPVIKASVLTFYWRIFVTPVNSSRSFRIAIWVITTYVLLWWISIFFATLFQCNPISDNWGTNPLQLPGCPNNISVMYQTAAFTNLVSDIVILALPFFPMSKLQLPFEKKIAVLCIFMTGSVVIVAGIGRTVSYFKLRDLADYDFSFHYYWIVLWTSIEPTLGVIGACLPTMRPFFSGVSPESVIRSIRSQLSLHSLRSSKGSPKGSRKGSPKNSPNATSHSGPSSDSSERFVQPVAAMDDPDAAENYITNMELEDRSQMGKAWNGKGNDIHINQDVHQRTDDMV
ncbi:MAG: hypothetical protein ASARMPREDX12_002653 [Alectoria sarmentosa]|nr:MAG: hypothetical protein ASARMPREDX12_002653 [Alectoria sarmentosa]